MKFNCRYCGNKLEIDNADIEYYKANSLIQCPICGNTLDLSLVFNLQAYTLNFISKHEKLIDCENALLKLYTQYAYFVLRNVENELAQFKGTTYTIGKDFPEYVDSTVRELIRQNKVLSQIGKTTDKTALLETLEGQFQYDHDIYCFYYNPDEYAVFYITVNNPFETVVQKIYDDIQESFSNYVRAIIPPEYAVSSNAASVLLDIIKVNIYPHHFEDFLHRYLGEIQVIFEGGMPDKGKKCYVVNIGLIIPDDNFMFTTIRTNSNFIKFLCKKGYLIHK